MELSLFCSFRQILTAGLVHQDALDTDTYVNHVSAAAKKSPLGDINGVVTAVFGLITDLVRFVGDNTRLNISLSAEGVTCAGVTSLLVLPITALVTAIIVLVFDSSLFSMLEIATMEYKHHVSYQLHRFGLSPEYARWFESVFMVGFFFGMQSMIQNLTQVTIATMLVAEYVPYWNRRTAACEEPIDRGGVPGSEWASSFLATAIFYFIGPFIIVCNLT
jgi:hypothetical protein